MEGKGTDNTTYTTVVPANLGYDGTVYWPFDTSVIPAEATIDSVSCEAKGRVTSTSAVTTANLQLCSGSTVKGSAVSFKVSSATVKDIPAGTWTREELASIRLKCTVKGSTTAGFRIYGADLTVTYTYQSEKFMLKLGGKDARLPDGYTRLSYLESDGSQYIKTNIPVKSTTGFVVDFALSRTSGENGIVGAFNYGGVNHNFSAYGGKWNTQYGDNESYMFGAADTNRHVVSQNVTPATTIFDGETVKSGAVFYDNPERTFNLFCYNGGSSYPNFWIAPQKQWGAQFYDSGVLVGDFIPCINPAGIAGMYDAVGGVFHRSASGTDFSATEKFWHDIARTFKKVSGIWVEQEELANVIEDGVRFQNGGEIESTGPTLITFTIAGTSYQAEEGMTWAEWIASSYNTAGYIIMYGNQVYDKSAKNVVCDTGGNSVNTSQTITSGYAYKHY